MQPTWPQTPMRPISIILQEIYRLAVSREVDAIDHHDHVPEEETDVAEDVAARVAATDHMAVTEDVAAVPRAAVHPVAPLGLERALLLSIAAHAAPTVVASCVTRLLWPVSYTHLRAHETGA
eukprot:4612340-Pyramimonas_sp.AAC.1